MSENVDKMMAEAQRRQARLLELLKSAPIVDIIGVVDANGAGGGRSRGEELWTLLVSLLVWRVGSGTIRHEDLNIRREVTHEHLQELRSAFQPYGVVQFRGRLVTDDSAGSPTALLESDVTSYTADAQLNEAAAKLQLPVTHDDPQFGTLTLDRRIDWFRCQTEWEGEAIELSLEEPERLADALATARTLWLKQASWNQRIQDFAVSELLELKNDTWREGNEAELTPADFKARMKLESITACPDGSFVFWHDDGGLFWGHSIEIRGNLADGPQYADIPG